MNLVPRRDLLDRLVPAQCLKRHASLELTRKPPSRRHLVSLRYTAEYTLTPRPIFQDQLKLRKQFRAATIQAFEFTYELSMKMLRRQLAEIALSPTELPQLPFMDFIRTAADAGLVREVLPFRAYREKRNITSHTYNEDRAEEVVAGLDEFVADMRFILAQLKRRNA
ncbi:MAG: HI0074 family nucleotidyltransferase substrate-binding subunit [Stellaceae bacterium]